jgi:hypothetical protein
MAKPRPEKKHEQNDQPQLPGPLAAPSPAARRVLPMELQVGDRLTYEAGEWEIVVRPYTTAGGKNARVRVQRVGEPTITELRTWGAHERIT